MDNLFQGVGLVACIGTILLVVLVAAVARRAFGARTPGSARRDDPFVNQGRERPRYDSDEIESSGGFGSGPRQTRGARDFDSPNAGFGQARDLDERPSRPINRDRDLGDRPSRPLHRDRDDDEVSSRGGFGG